MNNHRARYWSAAAAAAAAATLLAACSSSSSSSSSSGTATKPPILIGTSLSLTGDFSADGTAFKQGYELWAKDVNAAGGLLGRQVKLDILNDASSPTQVVANYTTLISTDHVDMTFGPFSSLLTTPASAVAARNGFAFIEGAGGAPSVFTTPSNESAHNVFDVSLPVASEMVPFANYIASLPASQRPKTAAYPMAQDPFADPPVQTVQTMLVKAGIKTVYSNIFPAEVASYTPAADNVAAAKPDIVVLGSTDVPTVSAFIKAFIQQHYTPKYFIAAAGPDQGTAFTSVVGAGNANGMLVPNGWYPGSTNPLSQKMITEYVAQYGGAPSGVSSDVAEAYSVGLVAQAAITATGGTNQAKIMAYLHAGHTFQTIQGPVMFDALGHNNSASTYIFQWQGSKFVQVLPAADPASVKILAPKPAWTG